MPAAPGQMCSVACCHHTPLCMGHSSQTQSPNPQGGLAPALPPVAWTLQGKLMNPNLMPEPNDPTIWEAIWLHSPTQVLSPQPTPESRNWSWAEASKTSVGLNVHLCNTWSSGFYLYFFTAYRICTRALQITIY